jgi:hypothetical protein
VSRLRRERSSGGKTDALDAIRAARSVLGQERPATPRAGGERQALQALEEAYASRQAFGAPAWEIDGWVSTYTAFAAGEFDVVTDHVMRLTGHQPVSIEQFIESSQ